MRTTVSLDEDVAVAVDQLRQEQGLGLSAAVNQLVRQGLVRRQASKPYVHRAIPLGLRMDVTNIGEVLDILDSEH